MPGRATGLFAGVRRRCHGRFIGRGCCSWGLVGGRGGLLRRSVGLWGRAAVSLFRWLFAAAVRIRSKHHGHAPSRCHAGHGFDLADVCQGLTDLLERIEPQLFVGHFPATELHGELDLIAFAQELLGLFGFDRQIVFVDLGPKAHFFELAVLAVAASFLLFLLLLILPLAVVHDPADGRLGTAGDFYQVQLGVAGTALGVFQVDDADLFVVLVD